jgi:hypothetical protein
MNDAGQEGISEGFRLAQSERAVPGGAGATGSATPFPGLTEKKKRQFEVNRASGIQALCARNASR